MALAALRESRRIQSVLKIPISASLTLREMSSELPDLEVGHFAYSNGDLCF